MEPWKMYNDVVRGPWNTSGLDVQWKAQMVGGVPYLAFQGSASAMDWVNNFRFAAALYKGQESALRVHKGFGKAWKSCNDEVMASFVKLCSQSKETPVITGHSFGGAMALLAAEDFYYRTKVKPCVATFGAPKVVWGKKSKEYFSSCATFIEYEERNDIVPFCPPIPGYKHLEPAKIGDKFCLFKLFNPGKWHQIYGEKEEYFK